MGVREEVSDKVHILVFHKRTIIWLCESFWWNFCELRTMTDPKLAELPIEKEYSENINKQMRVPQSIRLTDSFQDPYFETSSLNDEYEKHKIGNSMKITRRISYGPNERREQENYFATGIIPPWPIITQNRGDGVRIETPPRTLRVNGLSTNEFKESMRTEKRSRTTSDLPSLSSKYPAGQTRLADTTNPLAQYDFNEKEFLADLDNTTEVEKLRQQNFKLHRRITKIEKERSEDNFINFSVALLCLTLAMGFTYIRTRD